MRVALLTSEYPPDVYGGAGVHVEYLGRELSGRMTSRSTAGGEPATAPGRGRARGRGRRSRARSRTWRRCEPSRST